MLNLLRKPKRSPNIVVYFMSSIDKDGQARSTPLGYIPRFSQEYEDQIRKEHQPKETAFIHHKMGDASIILAWTGKSIDAVCFLSETDARSLPHLVEFPDRTLDPVLNHFPR